MQADTAIRGQLGELIVYEDELCVGDFVHQLNGALFADPPAVDESQVLQRFHVSEGKRQHSIADQSRV